jgi:hypothetical protein
MQGADAVMTQSTQGEFDARNVDLCEESEGGHYIFPNGVIEGWTLSEHQGNATGDVDLSERSEGEDEGPSRLSFAGNTTVTPL